MLWDEHQIKERINPTDQTIRTRLVTHALAFNEYKIRPGIFSEVSLKRDEGVHVMLVSLLYFPFTSLRGLQRPVSGITPEMCNLL